MKHQESIIQRACVRWFRIRHSQYKRLLFSIPNGAVLRGHAVERAKQWKRLEYEGAIAGAADLMLCIANEDFNGLFIEVKTETGRQRKNQKDFEKAVVAAGYGYEIVRSFDEFEELITNYLKTKKCE